MNASELGRVYGQLLKYRHIHGNPVGRPLREGELEAAQVLASCGQHELAELDEFLESQGYTLYYRDAFEFGIPSKPGRPNTIYVMTRKRGAPLAPYMNSGWVIDQMRDGRRADTKAELAVWVTRLWLTMQWFFYQNTDRAPSQVSGYRDAMISERGLNEAVAQGIEQLGNEGRPEGDGGLMFDVLWEGKKSIPSYVARFLKVMEAAGMIEPAGNPGEFHQTLLAAVDMAEIAENELAYLMPPANERSIDTRSIELLTGATLDTDGDEHAANPAY